MLVILQPLLRDYKAKKWSVRLVGLGRKIFILKIAGSNPARTTN